MNATKPRTLLLSLSIAFALAACGAGPDTADADVTPAGGGTADAPRYTLDEGRLPPVNRFQASDLDTSVNACHDFNAYANGKWLAANEIPGDRTSWGSFEMLTERTLEAQRQLAEQAAANESATGVEKIVGDFWATGMDRESIDAQGIAPIQDVIDAIEALDSPEALADYLRSSAADGRNVLFGFGASPDFKDSAVNIAYASQGGLGLPDKTYYFEENHADKLAAYEQHVARVLELSGIEAAQAASLAADVVAFETRLADKSRSRVEMARDAELFYNPVSMEEADALTPNFPWTAFFESQGVDTPEMFSLAMPEFHGEVDAMLTDVPVETWKAYLRFHSVDDASPYLSSEFVQASYDFYDRTLRGQQEMEPEWKRVLGTINRQVGEALGQMYVEVAFSPESKERMEELVDNLSEALRDRIENLDWMGEETKARAMEKWETFDPKIGYPDTWRDWSGLETSRDSYIGNVLAANAYNYRWNLGKIGEPVDPDEWFMPPQMVNAYYNPQRNEIVFPAAILQPPFFDPEADDALNYGGIGAVIGHEMIHGYDDQGSRFDPKGNFENWWSEEDAAGFGALTGQLIDQFNAYEAAPGQFVDGKLTLGENIADLGGLAVAHDALQRAREGEEDPMIDGLTQDQRFFLNWATVWRRNFTDEELKVRLATDSHAPASFRAAGAPSNLPAFAEAFDCKPGDAMVRGEDERIDIW
ncbi:M13 family metallopeptidase [Luteimonas sp. JM171]|uniref:M13 family metallopeptidase n=1 Tax=Luteimonas sp. JM171 TaxID=1896164 RepID=UPI000858D6FF|nr:M13-type metalloendopeptidase [Luteimonas sp. JM171]AOH36539.1 peptidase [Luteimonas sp. JM171]